MTGVRDNSRDAERFCQCLQRRVFWSDDGGQVGFLGRGRGFLQGVPKKMEQTQRELRRFVPLVRLPIQRDQAPALFQRSQQPALRQNIEQALHRIVVGHGGQQINSRPFAALAAG